MSIPKPKDGAVVAAPEVAVEAPKKSKLIAVKAIEKGFYDNVRRNPGDKFEIKSEKHFSQNWMEKL